MKTKTITLHDTDNCGSSLQTFGLQHFLLKNGIENEIINYVPSYTQNNGHRIKTQIRKIVFLKDSYTRAKKFKQFKKNHLLITKMKYRTYKQLCKNVPDADVYIAGSDQLWNSQYACGQDPAFYLAFAKSGKKVAYAASAGREKIPNENLEIIEKYCKEYEWVSVREKSSVLPISNVLKKQVEHVCDPVLLNDIDEYDEIKCARLYKEPYILVYMAQTTNLRVIETVVEQVKKEKNAKVVVIGTYKNRCACDVHKRDVAPSEFLSLICHAEYIVSNSFHATMFSLMYKRQFMTVIPPSNGARIKEILDVVGLSDHAITDDNMGALSITPEQYEKVYIKMLDFREKSQKLLLKIIGGVYE